MTRLRVSDETVEMFNDAEWLETLSTLHVPLYYQHEVRVLLIFPLMIIMMLPVLILALVTHFLIMYPFMILIPGVATWWACRYEIKPLVKEYNARLEKLKQDVSKFGMLNLSKKEVLKYLSVKEIRKSL